MVTRVYEKTSSVSKLIKELKWEKLEVRRKNQRLSLLYKSINDLCAIPTENYLAPNTSRTRQGNNNNYRTIRSNSEHHRNSFFPRTIRDWNALPTEVKGCNTLSAFQEKLTTK